MDENKPADFPAEAFDLIETFDVLSSHRAVKIIEAFYYRDQNEEIPANELGQIVADYECSEGTASSLERELTAGALTRDTLPELATHKVLRTDQAGQRYRRGVRFNRTIAILLAATDFPDYL